MFAWVANNLASFTVAALWLFIPSVPLTHGLGLVAHRPKDGNARHLLLYLVKGGKHHFIFQLVSWGIWGASVLVAAPVALRHWQALHMPPAHVEVLSGAAATGAVFAELFMIKSLLVFNPASRSVLDGSASDEPVSPVWNTKRLPSKPVASAAVVALGIIWAVLGGCLLLATEYLQAQRSKEVYFVLACCCMVVGATTTHGIGGKLRHGDTDLRPSSPAGRDVPGDKARWRFFQPFRGGIWFVTTQAMGWVLFTASLICLCWLLLQVAAGMAYCIRCWIIATGSVMFAAQLLLGISVWTFQGRTIVRKVGRARPSARRSPGSWAAVWMPVLLGWTPVHMFCFAVVGSFMTLPPSFVAAGWTGGFLLYYMLTAPGQPEHTGRREWPWAQAWIARNIEASLAAWFGSVEVVREGSQPLDPAGRYIFGYTPHGLFPLGAGYLPYLPEFRRLLPNITPSTLVASVVFFTPLIRDLCSWSGLRQVSRRTFIKALGEKGSVLLVPGGQAELVHTWRMHQSRPQFVVYTRHKGFIRLAIEQNAQPVPVVALGEIDALRNGINWPWMQQWTYKKLGFPVPYLVVGRWGVSPFPRQTGLKFIVGEPVTVPHHEPGTPVCEDVLHQVHTEFYDQVKRLFLKHAPSFPGYANVELVMKN